MPPKFTPQVKTRLRLDFAVEADAQTIAILAGVAIFVELFEDCGIDLVYFSAQPSVQAKFFCEIDYGKKTFPREWYRQNPTLEAVTEWKQLKEMQRVPMVWIRIVEKIDTNSLS